MKNAILASVAVGLLMLTGIGLYRAHQAVEVDRAMTRVANAAALAGQPAAAMEAQAHAAYRAMRSSGVMPRESALSAAEIIHSLPMLSGAARRQLANLAPALYRTAPQLISSMPTLSSGARLQLEMFAPAVYPTEHGNDRALAQLISQFGTMGGLRSLIATLGPVSVTQAPAIAAAERHYDLGALQTIVLGMLTQRLSGVSAAPSPRRR